MAIQIGAAALVSLAVIGPIVARVLVALGIGFVTYTGFGMLLDQITVLIHSNVGALPYHILTLLQMAQVDKAISLIISAAAARAMLAGWSSISGNMRRPHWGG